MSDPKHEYILREVVKAIASAMRRRKLLMGSDLPEDKYTAIRRKRRAAA